MKNIHIVTLLNLLLVAIVQPSDVTPDKEQKNLPVAILHIQKELTLLNHIVSQAQIIIESVVTHEEYTFHNINDTLSSIRTILDQFMNDLDPYIKKTISEEINIIKQTTIENINESIHAYKILIAKVEAINAQANVAQTAQKATQIIDGAPHEIKEQVALQQKDNILAAEQQAQNKNSLHLLKSQLFGNEISWTKAAFYTAASIAAIGGLYYGYQHAEDIKKNTHTAWWDMVKRTTGYKSPFDHFLENIEQLNKIMKIVYQAEQQVEKNPTPQNHYVLESAIQLYNEQGEKIEQIYQYLTPEQQKKAIHITDKIIDSL